MKRLLIGLCLITSSAWARSPDSRVSPTRNARVPQTLTGYKSPRIALNEPVDSPRITNGRVAKPYGRPDRTEPDSRLGVMTNLNFSYGKTDPSQSGATRNAFGFYGFWQRRLSHKFALLTELHYAPRGVRTNLASFAGINISGDVRLDYLEIPVLLRFNAISASPTSPGFFFLAGPSFALALHRGVEVAGLMELDLANRFSQTDFLVHFGMGLEYPLSPYVNLTTNLRYVMGLKDIDGDATSYYTRHIQMSAGISWSW